MHSFLAYIMEFTMLWVNMQTDENDSTRAKIVFADTVNMEEIKPNKLY